MALLFCDSFDHYALADILQKWTSSSAAGINTTYGRFGSGLQLQLNNNVTKYLAPGDAVFGLGFAYKPPSLGSSDIAAIGHSTTSFNSGRQVSLAQNTAGRLEVRLQHAGGTLIGTTSIGLTGTGAWDYIEWWGQISNTGWTKVWINGVLVLDLATADTYSSGTVGWEFAVLGLGSNIGQGGYDDVYICDGTGSSWNTAVGDVRVDARRATADGNSAMSTPSTGTDRYATVDDTSANGDTDYNTLAAVNDKDTFGFQDVPVSGVTPLAVQVCIQARKTDAGTGSVCPVIRHSGSDNDGTGVALSTSYAMVRQVYEQNPGAGPGAWTEADFNAAEFGYKRTA